ncbi:hypothetical protein AB0O31_33375 [Kitasatospora cineracea]|uniref:hypothetical protein n=1 Tax=Kitasatospora cineracea TaxID=88074 RepID=UPI003449790D
MSDNDPDGLIRRFPIGKHVPGRVRNHLMPRGDTAAGALVELEGLPVGFVDAEHLPRGRAQWPRPGTTTGFEILRHDVRRPARLQIRLWPLETAFRNPASTHWGHPDEQWQQIKQRHPVGTHVTGTVTSTHHPNRWLTVTFDGTRSRVTYLGAPPPLGSTLHLRVVALSEATHRIILTPAPEPPPDPEPSPAR